MSIRPSLAPLGLLIHIRTNLNTGLPGTRLVTFFPLIITAIIILAGCSGPSDSTMNGRSNVELPTSITAPSIDLSQEKTTQLSHQSVNARILIAEANTLEHDGFWEDAAIVRSTILNGKLADAIEPTILANTHIAQIRLFQQLELPLEAKKQLKAAQEMKVSIDNSNLMTLYLLEGQILSRLGDIDGAIRTHNKYLEAKGAAANTINLYQARLLEQVGKLHKAEQSYNAILASPTVAQPDLEAALLGSGLLFENQERHKDAISRYQQLYNSSAWTSDRTLALYRIGIVQNTAGNFDAAQDAWLNLINDYPWHWRAAEAYEKILETKLSIAPITAGILQYNQGNLDVAEEIFRRELQNATDSAGVAIASFHLAKILENRGAFEDAIGTYLASANKNPNGKIAKKALWEAGKLLEQRNQFGLAAVSYQRAATHPMRNDITSSASFRWALMAYLAGNYQSAEGRFLELTKGQENTGVQKAWLWLGKTRDVLGKKSAADSAYAAAYRVATTSYHGLRAQALLENINTVPQANGPNLEEIKPVDWAQTEAWLEEQFGPEPGDLTERLSASISWKAGLDLQRGGFLRAAGNQFQHHIRVSVNDPWMLYRTAESLEKFNLFHLQIEVANTILEKLPWDVRLFAPSQILRWTYPLAWPSLTRSQAEKNQIDELLLYAMIRQESRFNPDAGSVAGALGLTQVIPSTAADIASALSDDTFSVDLLFRPEKSIEYGAYYLGKMLSQFNNNSTIALAAYNGGPGNAISWSNENSSIDPDVFYEKIRYQETRSYVQLVLENYAWYQLIYRQTEEPTLLPAP